MSQTQRHEEIHISGFAKPELSWPIIRIPANNLNIIMRSRTKYPGMSCPSEEPQFYDLKTAEVNFSPARIETGEKIYSLPAREFICYQYRTASDHRAMKFMNFCREDPAIKEIEIGRIDCAEDNKKRNWVVLVNACEGGFGSILESEIFPWAESIGAELLHPETEAPVWLTRGPR
jgi:hypothetical protein